MMIKNAQALEKMRKAGKLLAEIFENIKVVIRSGVTTLEIDRWIAEQLQRQQLVSQSLGYHGYNHVSCISVNDMVVHGIPSAHVVLKDGDLVKVDVCAAWQGYCADMARAFIVSDIAKPEVHDFIRVAQESLDAGLAMAVEGNRLYDISAAIQNHVEKHGYGVVRDFAGHAIGKNMHENPDVPNFGYAGTGMRLKEGMTFAIEPMITQGSYLVYVTQDGWTVKTKDGSLAMHVEDTVLVGKNGPEILTRL